MRAILSALLLTALRYADPSEKRSEKVCCQLSLHNQPVGVESEPATLRREIHIGFLDAGEALFNFLTEQLINDCLDSAERENDGEIPNQQWKPAKESEKGKP
jgi:hypothetical protein